MRILLASALALLLAGAARAQTTGLPFANDLSWASACAGSQGSLGTSCTASTVCCGLSIGGSLRFSTGSPGAPAYLLVSTNCVPNSPCMPIVTAYGIPFSACGATTNQSLDLVGYAVIPIGVTDADGFLTVPVPPLTYPWLDVQAAVFDPGSGSTFPFVFSQALRIDP